MKKILYILTILCTVIGLHSCTDNYTEKVSGTVVDGDQIHIVFSTRQPDPVVVNTRALDPTGTGVNVLWLFNFDKEGAFLGRVNATLLTAQGQTDGKFEASIPSSTRIVHLLANQNLDSFNDDAMLGKHENTVMNGLVSTSGGLVYWGRVADTSAADADAFASFLSTESPFTLYRNMAKVEVSGVEIDGLAVCNQFVYGASVPFYTYAEAYPEATPDTITLPENRTKMVDPTDVENEVPIYMFETPNSGNDAVSVILRVKNTQMYYKIQLIDGNKKPLPVIRNHSYNIIFGPVPDEADGYKTFADAKAGAAYNNAMVAIDEDIPSVTIGGVTLGVNETKVVCITEGDYPLHYTYTGGEEVSATWISNDGVASSTITCDQPENNKGIVHITVNPINGVHSGTIMVKAGLLIRYIKVFSVDKFKFTPIWVSNGVYNGDTEEDVALVFNIPEDYPEELLPVRCLITTNQLDGNELVHLSVINEEDCMVNGVLDKTLYGEPNNYGYKYVYEANSTGMHRIYFQTSRSGQDSGNIILEANYFEMATETFHFTDKNQKLRVTGDKVYSYSGSSAGSSNATVRYYLVPRYAGSLVTFSIRQVLQEENSEDEIREVVSDFTEPQTIWIYTSKLKPYGMTLSEGTTTDGGHYYIYNAIAGKNELTFETLAPDCVETIRVASVVDGAPGTYKSTTLELENYLKWTFPLYFEESEETTETSVPYGIDQSVTLKLNLKAATSSHEKDQVYPTGTYQCYIYTENLEPDGDNTKDSNNYLDPVPKKDDEGKTYYIYHVSKDVDATDDVDVRELSFKTNKIVSAETITLKPQTEKISFEETTATIANKPIEGIVTYGADQSPVPSDGFVTLIRKDGTRIGIVKLGENGSYSMTLRSEYNYGWEESLHMYYSLTDGTIYSSDEITLSKLMQNANINLPNMEKNN